MMHLMGLPHDYEIDAIKSINHIAQVRFFDHTLLENHLVALVFNAAQPGVGRVQVLGIKKLLLRRQLFNQNLV